MPAEIDLIHQSARAAAGDDLDVGAKIDGWNRRV
jgi:hypothetical protein